MAGIAHQAGLDALLQHPSLWRARNAAPVAVFPTGFAGLDRVLPGGGWPRSGLIEVLVPGAGNGELQLWAPLVARLTQAADARWCAFVSPPFEPFVPAWCARGARADRLLVARGDEPLWVLEQSLLSGACALAFGWIARAGMRELRRLVLAAERGAALGVLIRPLRAAPEHSPAVLRLALSGQSGGLHVQLLKGRGIAPVSVRP